MPIFYFNSIPPYLQQWLPIITETSKIQCRMVITQVLDENQSLFLILLTRFLFFRGHGVSAKVKDKKTTHLLWLLINFPPKFLASHREKPIHPYLTEVKSIKGINYLIIILNFIKIGCHFQDI